MTDIAGIRTRPIVVTIASALMVITAVGYLADAVGLLAGVGGYPDGVRAGAEEAGLDPRAIDVLLKFAPALPIVAALMTGIAAIVLLVLARLVARGSFAGRIVSWVAIGLARIMITPETPWGAPPIPNQPAVSDQQAQWLSELVRRHQRGELTNEQYAAETLRILGH